MHNLLLEKIENKTAVIGIIGLGYVGLPLALEYALKGFKTIGFDIDEKKIPILNSGKSYIKHIKAEKIQKTVNNKKFFATADFSRLPEVDAIIVCVPTPLNAHREPDMTYIENSGKIIAQYLRAGQFVSLESSTYPGTTEEILLPMFENAPITQNSKSKNPKPFTVGKDFYLAFSPEREDPNNLKYSTATIPKVVGGVTPICLKVALAIYNQVIVKTVPVSSPRAAEATKLLENIYRSINIALVNELKMVFGRMDIDIWEVIDAAATKPFGFQPFYPGPGLGGHCIPIDPFYLTWKAREFEISTKFIELAGEINTFMPHYVIEKVAEVLNKSKKSLNGSKVLILGASYKKDIDDMRESPSLKLIEILREKGVKVDYNDPYVDKLPKTRKYEFDLTSVELSKNNLSKYDLVLLSTDHSNYNYKFIASNAKLIVDTRNAFEKAGVKSEKVFKG
ncbi:MAG: nucleotide sugar dehydrogenase [Ignavibacteriaceae bacterium]|nr:nucleotide sugar dehydrogenase [Ignavibacteriaceae bacterium]